jgi:hypothetical protein
MPKSILLRALFYALILSYLWGMIVFLQYASTQGNGAVVLGIMVTIVILAISFPIILLILWIKSKIKKTKA